MTAPSAWRKRVLSRRRGAPVALPVLEPQRSLNYTNPSPTSHNPVARGFAHKVIRRLRPGSHTRTFAREALILSLETLKESTSVFPPLESAAGGVLKFITCHETMTRNTADRQKLYDRAAIIYNDLEHARRYLDSQVDSLSDRYRAVRSSIETFELSLHEIIRDVDIQIAGSASKGRIRQLVLARYQKSQIADFLSRLSEAEGNFRRALALEVHSLGLDTNHRVGAVQSTTAAQHDVVQSKLQTLTATVADLQRETNNIQEMTSVHHRAIQGELHTMKSGIIIIYLTTSVGLFAVARS